jgi:hypothetical protein
MFSLLSQLVKLSKARGKIWMAPLMLLLLAFGMFLVLVGQSAALAPFIYAIF